MGIVKALLLLPLAPVTGLKWLTEVLVDEAEREQASQQSPERALADLDAMRATGEIADEDADALEEQLIEQMLAGHGLSSGPSDADPDRSRGPAGGNGADSSTLG
jgi:hypothetical protein